MSKIVRGLKTTQRPKAKQPSADTVAPHDREILPKPQSEELADILQMAEASGRRTMEKVRPRMEKAIRAALKNSTT